MKMSARFLLGVFISRLGDSFSFLAFTLLLMGQGTSNSKVSLFMVARYLPSVLIGLFLKKRLDLWPRKTVLLLSYLASGLLTGLAVFCIESPDLLLGLSLFLGVAYGFYVPLQRAMIPEVFPKEKMKQANVWVQMSDISAKTIGFLLAGLTFHKLGAQVSFSLDAISFFLIAVLLSPLKSLSQSWSPVSTAKNPVASGKQLNLASGIFALTWLGTGTLFALEASYAKLYMGASETMIGWLFACATLGSVFTPLLIRRLKNEVRLQHLSGAAICEIVFVAAYGLCNNIWLASLFIALYGTFLTVRHILMASWIHTQIPSAQQASAFAFQQGQANLAMLLGMGLCGPLSEVFGVRALILTAAALSFLGILALSLKAGLRINYFVFRLTDRRSWRADEAFWPLQKFGKPKSPA
jgi:MFS transporter, DHA3 family, macrolide efflux protein